MKTCKKCGESKPIDAFYKYSTSSEGRSGVCKECRKVRVSENRRKRLHHYQEYEKQRAALRDKQDKSEYRKANKTKLYAHRCVNRAIKQGDLVRPLACESCGSVAHTNHAHHDDYARPLEVRWLCPGCHKRWHVEHGEAKNGDMPLTKLRG